MFLVVRCSWHRESGRGVIDSIGDKSVYNVATLELLAIVCDKSVGYTKLSDDVVLYKLQHIILCDSTNENYLDPISEVVCANYGKLILLFGE